MNTRWEDKTAAEIYTDLQRDLRIVLMAEPSVEIVERWRGSHPKIVQAWKEMRAEVAELQRRAFAFERPPVFHVDEKDNSPVAQHAPQRGRWSR